MSTTCCLCKKKALHVKFEKQGRFNQKKKSQDQNARSRA
jgi:hypothetical protein